MANGILSVVYGVLIGLGAVLCMLFIKMFFTIKELKARDAAGQKLAAELAVKEVGV